MMLNLINQFQKDAQKLERDPNSIEELKMWIEGKGREEDPFEQLVGEVVKADDKKHEVYFADSYIELESPDGRHYLDQFPYPEDGETVVGGAGYELYYNDSDNYLEFIKDNRIVVTLYLDEIRK